MKSPGFEYYRRRSRLSNWIPRDLSDPSHRIAGGFASEDPVLGQDFGSSREFYWRQAGVVHALDLHSLGSRWNQARGARLWEALGEDVRPVRHSPRPGRGWKPRERHAGGGRRGRSDLAARKRIAQRQAALYSRLGSGHARLAPPAQNWEYQHSLWDQGWMSPDTTPVVHWRVEARTVRWGVMIRADLILPPDLTLTSEAMSPILASIRDNFRTPGRLNPLWLGTWSHQTHTASQLSGPPLTPPWVGSR